MPGQRNRRASSSVDMPRARRSPVIQEGRPGSAWDASDGEASRILSIPCLQKRVKKRAPRINTRHPENHAYFTLPKREALLEIRVKQNWKARITTVAMALATTPEARV